MNTKLMQRLDQSDRVIQVEYTTLLEQIMKAAIARVILARTVDSE